MGYNNIGFIGCGSMVGALAGSVAKGGTGSRLYFADTDKEKAASLAKLTFGTEATNNDIAAKCDLIFIAVTPQALETMIRGIKTVIAARRDRFVIVSMVAGVTTERLAGMLGRACPIIRIMPNTPTAVGEGMMQICRRDVTDAELTAFAELMRYTGKLDELDEGLIDAASAVSGCGPAFLCLVMEGMADGGVALGLPRDKALKYAAQALIGTGKLALETNAHPGVIKDSVTSPGGATIQGVRELEAGGVRSNFMEAVIAAYDKTMELKQNT